MEKSSNQFCNHEGRLVPEYMIISKNTIFRTQKQYSKLIILGNILLEHVILEELLYFFLFRKNPRPFNTWAKEFFPGINYLPNAAHYFLKVLQEKEKLAKYFTQNIDGLERLAGTATVHSFLCLLEERNKHMNMIDNPF